MIQGGGADFWRPEGGARRGVSQKLRKAKLNITHTTRPEQIEYGGMGV